ncbi:helix-turn-helix domain-containing protein, partial [Lactobacillus nasalidis]
MLYDPHLDIFLQAAELGSFSKAAEANYITPSAVIKQIDLLEARLG